MYWDSTWWKDYQFILKLPSSHSARHTSFSPAIHARMLPAVHVVTVALSLAVVTFASYPENPWEPFMYGRYCSSRGGPQCCPGRDDYCAVPFQDTYCYCDMFCGRSVADCCPDFWKLCKGIAPPFGAKTFPPTPVFASTPPTLKVKSKLCWPK